MICNECETVAHCTSHGCIPKQTAVDRLLDEAKLLADDRPVEVGHLPEWTLNAEHMIRRLVKALAEQPAPVQQEPVALQMDVIVVNLVREGVNKHRARELAEHFIKHTSPPAQQEPVGRTDQQIVNQTEELAVWLLSWAFNRQPETPTPMRESRHPMAERCWAAACHIQEMLTSTDPENSVAELDDSPDEGTSPPAQRKPLTKAQVLELWEQTYVQRGSTGIEFARAIEAAHGIKGENT